MGFFEKLFHAEAASSRFAVTEIHDTQALTDSLRQKAPYPERLTDPEVAHNLELLVSLSERAHRKLFTIETGNGIWCVNAPSAEDVQRMKKHILAADAVQERFYPPTLRGSCIAVHEFVCTTGAANGTAESVPVTEGDAIYVLQGHHSIARKDDKGMGRSLYIDLTARAYVFAPDFDPTEAPALGYMAIDPIGTTSTIDTMYGTTWRLEDFHATPRERGLIMTDNRHRLVR